MPRIDLIKCNVCGKYFRTGNRPDGLPNGVGFFMEDGKVINVCADCIMKVGEIENEKMDGD